MTLTGGSAPTRSARVTNLTDGGDITADFSTVGTGTLTQTTATDYSAKKLLVQLHPHPEPTFSGMPDLLLLLART